MRSVFFSFMAVISTSGCLAQRLSPSVINLSGFNFTLNHSQFTIAIGEPSVTTLKGARATITQGFLQPEILPCEDVAFSYYPNPAINEITVEAYGCEIKIEWMQLFDLWGRLISEIAPRKDNKVELDGLGSGVYVMRVRMTSGTEQSFKIVKVTP